MIRHLATASVAFFSLVALAPAHAAVGFLSAETIASATARTFQDGAQTGSGDGYRDITITAFQPRVGVGAKAQATSSDKDGADTAASTATERSNAYFTSASNGYFDLTGATTAVSFASGASADAYSGQSAVYTFTIDTASVINLSYLVSGSATSDGADTVLYLGSPDLYSNVLFSGTLTPNSSGALIYDLAAGTYVLDLFSELNDSVSVADLGASAGSHEERLSFDIQTSAAPEPSTWALLLVGVGFGGLALRLRNRSVTTAV